MSSSNWMKHEIIYHILIDRFAGYHHPQNWEQPVFIGGNLQGIIGKLDYLEDLGVTTLWISPFYSASAYHGYHVTDFFHVDPHFGNERNLRQLIDQVHNRNMHIIADFIPNHCSRFHPFFLDAQKNKHSRYFNWFYFTKWPDEYQCFLRVTDIPKLNLQNDETRWYIIDAACFWLDFGFDGYRLDHVIGPPHDFWIDFSQTIHQRYPQAVLVGEAWMMGIKRVELKTVNIKHKYFKWLRGDAASDELLLEYVDVLDGVLDFRFQQLLQRFALSSINKEEILKKISRHHDRFPKDFLLPTFLDNHDMDRFLFLCRNNTSKLKQAAFMQFSLNQPPIIYYGTETGLSQQKSIWNIHAHGDIQARQPMNWADYDSDLLVFYKELIQKRKQQTF